MTLEHAWRGALVAALTAALLPAGGPVAAATAVPPSEWVIGPQKKVALITFDGVTSTTALASLVKTLSTQRAKASFFLPGRWVEAHRKQASLLRRAGHTLGNRGYSGARLTSLSEAALRSSIARAQEALNRAGVHPRPFLRAPDGARDLRVLRIAGSMGYRSVRWTHHPGGGTAKRVKREVARKVQPGSIISLDLDRRSHRRAVPGIINRLRRKGFELRTVEVLKRVHAVRWDVTLKAGSSGSEVYFLKKQLRSASYPAGKRNRSFDYAALQAVYAFEKANRLTRDGVVPPSQMLKIAAAKRPWVPDRGPAKFVEIDISRQVLFEVRDGKVRHTLPISSGNEEYYTVDGERRKAHTPRGNFRIERKIAGWRESDLGRLYYPSYFVGGYAIHGSTSVPTYPASHGCVRIPMYVTKAFFDRTPIGMPVFVHD